MGLIVLALALIVAGSLVVLAIGIRGAVPDPHDGDDDDEWGRQIQVWRRRQWQAPRHKPVETVLDRWRVVGHD